MLIPGHWMLCNDGIVRPVLGAEMLASDGVWRKVTLLVDTGADRTVLDATTVADLDCRAISSQSQLSGIGGQTPAVGIDTELRLIQATGQPTLFRGQFTGATDPDALDMSVLGRDILDLFAVITDRPGDVVCLVSQRHRYIIQES